MSQGNRESAGAGEAFKVHGTAAARNGKQRGKRRNGPVIRTHLDPLAELVALHLADGDRGRFQVISVTTVIVVNRPRRGRRTP